MSDICEFEVAKQQKILKILSVVVIVVVVEIADLLFVFQKFGNGLEKLEVVENTKLLNNVANLLGPGAPPRLAGTALERVHIALMARTCNKYLSINSTTLPDKIFTATLIGLTLLAIAALFWYQNFGPGFVFKHVGKTSS